MVSVHGLDELGEREKPSYQLGLRKPLSRMRIWRARGWSACHLVPHDAELAPEDKRGQSDEEKPEQEQRERDQATEERARSDFAVADGRDRCMKAYKVKASYPLCERPKISLTDDDKPCCSGYGLVNTALMRQTVEAWETRTNCELRRVTV